MSRTAGRRPRQRGMLLIGVLVALALAALVATQAGQRLADARQRADEEELLFVGEQYRQAIESYWRQSPKGVRGGPLRLDDLVEDQRFPQARHHLRKLFADPLAPGVPWGVIRNGNAIVGVYSQAEGVPFRQTGFSPMQRGFDGASRYADWRFVSSPPPGPAAPAIPSSPTPGVNTPPARGLR